MREKNWKKNLLTCFGAAVLFVAATLGFPVTSVHAESGSVYSCTINRCYSHPVTGEIEDSGGEASYATGQGMVEGAVYASGLMEVTDSGNYYLTIRMSLIDYTSGHSFSVQNVGDSGWSGTGVAVTANGSDSNGTTSDICIQGQHVCNPDGKKRYILSVSKRLFRGKQCGYESCFCNRRSSICPGFRKR